MTIEEVKNWIETVCAIVAALGGLGGGAVWATKFWLRLGNVLDNQERAAKDHEQLSRSMRGVRRWQRRFDESLEAGTDRMNDHERRLNTHDVQFENHEKRIGKIETNGGRP